MFKLRFRFKMRYNMELSIYNMELSIYSRSAKYLQVLYNVILKITQENKDWACCNGVTICPEINVTTCPDTVSHVKHEIAINEKAEENMYYT